MDQSKVTDQKLTDDQNQNGDEEIDLRKLFIEIGRFFVNIWIWFVGLIIGFRRISIRYGVLLIIAVLAACSWTTYKSIIQQKYFQRSIIIRSPYLSHEVIQNIVDQLNYTSVGDLSNKLQLDTNLTRKIRGFKFEPFLTEGARVDMEILNEKLAVTSLEVDQQEVIRESIMAQIQSFEIIFTSYDNDILKDISDALRNFCRNYEFINKRIEVNNAILEQRKAKIQNELIKLDSLKQVIYNNLESLSTRTRQGSNNVILAEDASTNPLNVINQDLELYDLELGINRRLALQEDFLIFEGAQLGNSPSNLNIFANLLFGLEVSLGVSYAIIFLIAVNRYLTQVEKRKADNENEHQVSDGNNYNA